MAAPPLEPRRAWESVLLARRNGIGWNRSLQEHGFGGGSACHKRLCAWAAAGVLRTLHRALVTRLEAAGQIDRRRAVVDSSSARAVLGGQTGANPTDRGRPGSKQHLLCEAGGTPLVARLSAANLHDVNLLLALVEAPPAGSQRAARPRPRPGARCRRARPRPPAPIVWPRVSLFINAA